MSEKIKDTKDGERFRELINILFANPKIQENAELFVKSMFDDHAGTLRDIPFREKLKLAYVYGIATGMVMDPTQQKGEQHVRESSGLHLSRTDDVPAGVQHSGVDR